MNKNYDSRPMFFMGMRFYENPNMTIPGPVETHPRTWKERLFTRPWRPFQKTKQVQTVIPDPSYYMLGKESVVGHPATIARIRGAFDSLENQ